MKIKAPRIAIILMALMPAFDALGETTSTSAPTLDVGSLVQQIKSQDALQQQSAVQTIRARMAADPVSTTGILQRSLLVPMTQANMHDAVADLSLQGVLASASSASTVEALMTYRVKSLLAQGKGVEALADAKSLFNVSSMAGTGNAILLLSESLQTAYPNDPDRARRYRTEQVVGMSYNSGRPLQPSKVFQEIHTRSDVFLKTLPRSNPEEYSSLVTRANVMLLADHVDEAREACETAYMLADNRSLPAATENLARCIKAQDGTIGRVNAFILALRPPATQKTSN